MKPMLAGKADDLSKLTFPVMASYKLDGVRARGTVEDPRTSNRSNSQVQIFSNGLEGSAAVSSVFGMAGQDR